MAAQFVSKGHFISKGSALAEFIEHLPTAADFGVIAFKIEKQRCTSLELKLVPITARLTVDKES